MGLFDALFGSGKPVTTGQQGASTSSQAMVAYYHIATTVIPERLFRDENHAFTGGRTFIRSIQESPQAVITELMVYVALASNGRGSVPPTEMGHFAKNFRPLCGDLSNNLKYLVIEYPRPLPMQVGSGTPVAGPFYSAFVYSDTESSVRYYVLRTGTSGRLDIGVARELFSDGTNFNLGNVSSRSEDFLTFIKKIETAVKPICGGIDKNGQVLPGGIAVVFRYYPQATQPGFMLLSDPTTGDPIVPAHWRPVMD